jgi:hypothetical protein
MSVASFDSERQLQAALGVMFPDLEDHGLFRSSSNIRSTLDHNEHLVSCLEAEVAGV